MRRKCYARGAAAAIADAPFPRVAGIQLNLRAAATEIWAKPSTAVGCNDMSWLYVGMKGSLLCKI